MTVLRCVAALAALLLVSVPLSARPFRDRIKYGSKLDEVNAQLHGRLVDFTNNHGCDRRIWSAALGEKRDMYVYVPPGYDGTKRYPILIWFHGFSQDEKDFLKLAPAFDKAVAEGKLPPMILAVPDGTFKGFATMTNSGSFFLNGKRGQFEDFLICDVWPFLTANFAVRPEKEAHILAGASMGGYSAVNLAIKHRDIFQIAVGIMPLLDLRYQDCHGNHWAPFDPNCLGRIENFRPWASAGRLFLVINIRQGKAMRPIFGNKHEVEERLPSENPADMLEIYGVQPGELKLFIAYGLRDQFNGAAENQSFMYFAGLRGITAHVETADGRHNKRTAVKFFEPFCEWLTPLLQPYVPK
jgi:S-formylglutathione hydrolase FrmB